MNVCTEGGIRVLKAKGWRPFLYSLTYHNNWKVAGDQSPLKCSPICHNQAKAHFSGSSLLSRKCKKANICSRSRIQYFWSVLSTKLKKIFENAGASRFLIEKPESSLAFSAVIIEGCVLLQKCHLLCWLSDVHKKLHFLLSTAVKYEAHVSFMQYFWSIKLLLL